MDTKEKKKGIVISTCKATTDFLALCLMSLPSDHEVMIVVNNSNDYHDTMLLPENLDPFKTYIYKNDWNGFELGAIARGMERFDEFFYMPDTCVLKDNALVDKLFSYDGSVSLTEGFFSYIGKYRREILVEVGVPKVENKKDAVHHERFWTEKYIKADPKYKLFEPSLPLETDTFVDIHDEKRMLIENDYIVKYKGTYGANVAEKTK